MKKEEQLLVDYAECHKHENIYYNNNKENFNQLVQLIKHCKNGFARSLATQHKDLVYWMNALLPKLNSNEYKLSTKCYWILKGLTDFPRCGNKKCNCQLTHRNVKLNFGYNKYCSVHCEVIALGTLKNAVQRRWNEFHKTVPFYVSQPCQRKAYNKLVYQILLQMPYYDQLKWLVENRPDVFSIVMKTKQFSHLTRYVNQQTPLLKDNKYTLITKIYWVLNHIDSWDNELVRCKTCNKPFIDKNCASAMYGYYMHCDTVCQSNDIEIIDKHIASYKKNLMDHLAAKDQTNLKKYGAYSWNQRLRPDQTLTLEQQANRLASRLAFDNTMLRRYGKIFKHNDYIDCYKPQCAFHFVMHTPYDKDRQIMSSHQENICYHMLHFAYPHLIRQYKSKEYPFNCDFYDKKTNTYFEYNGMWTHGGHFFDPLNKDDQQILKEMHSKNNAFYEQAIQVWTQYDVLKRQIAIANKLNYVVFWNLDEVMQHVLSVASK